MTNKPRKTRSVIRRVLLLVVSVYRLYSLGDLQVQLINQRKEYNELNEQKKVMEQKISELERLLEDGTEADIIINVQGDEPLIPSSVIDELIALMKESNVGTAKLFKKCHETYKFVEKSSMRDFTEDLVLIRDKVVNVRNLDEEIAKSGERSKIQLGDIQEDIQNQKKLLSEMESDLLYLLDSTEDVLK